MKKTNVLVMLQTISNQLMNCYHSKEICDAYAWWMLIAITGKEKSLLLAQESIMLNTKQHERLTSWINKQCNEHMPLQYLLGTVPFLNLEIEIEPPILIPRPETEEWVERLSSRLTFLKDKNIRILEIGTGSGCIALTLAQALPQATIIAVDINSQAISLAQRNAAKNGIKNIQFLVSNLFENVAGTFDLIVSNPPYISEQEFASLDQSVKQWEDYQALVASDNGLAVIKQLVHKAPHYLNSNKEFIKQHIPSIIIEIGYKQGQSVVKIMEQIGFTQVTIEHDIQNKERVVVGSIEACTQLKLKNEMQSA